MCFFGCLFFRCRLFWCSLIFLFLLWTWIYQPSLFLLWYIFARITTFHPSPLLAYFLLDLSLPPLPLFLSIVYFFLPTISTFSFVCINCGLHFVFVWIFHENEAWLDSFLLLLFPCVRNCVWLFFFISIRLAFVFSFLLRFDFLFSPSIYEQHRKTLCFFSRYFLAMAIHFWHKQWMPNQKIANSWIYIFQPRIHS